MIAAAMNVHEACLLPPAVFGRSEALEEVRVSVLARRGEIGRPSPVMGPSLSTSQAVRVPMDYIIIYIHV